MCRQPGPALKVTFPTAPEGVDKPTRLLLNNSSPLPTRSCHIEEEQNDDLTAVSALSPLSPGFQCSACSLVSVLT
ncbi:hypothetical protein JOB18_003452 [Solea senegalensis]|uniref:Uncharacterized protein n=1 Tax=Solea senegalensis TaxID=28829 RepID=A0AAV6R680_SOLSE|nr:hypothetical protein JOB18_003452 [Solea senegalensis]